jgi:membrane protein YdbS with pleckstrin-like domain
MEKMIRRVITAYRNWKERNPSHIVEQKLNKWWNAGVMMVLSLLLLASGGAQVYWMWYGAEWGIIMSCAVAMLFITFVIILIGKL